MEENENGEEHFGGDFRINAFELFQIDALFLSKDFFKQVLDLFLCLDAVEENLTVTRETFSNKDISI